MSQPPSSSPKITLQIPSLSPSSTAMIPSRSSPLLGLTLDRIDDDGSNSRGGSDDDDDDDSNSAHSSSSIDNDDDDDGITQTVTSDTPLQPKPPSTNNQITNSALKALLQTPSPSTKTKPISDHDDYTDEFNTTATAVADVAGLYHTMPVPANANKMGTCMGGRGYKTYGGGVPSVHDNGNDNDSNESPPRKRIYKPITDQDQDQAYLHLKLNNIKLPPSTSTTTHKLYYRVSHHCNNDLNRIDRSSLFDYPNPTFKSAKGLCVPLPTQSQTRNQRQAHSQSRKDEYIKIAVVCYTSQSTSYTYTTVISLTPLTDNIGIAFKRILRLSDSFTADFDLVDYNQGEGEGGVIDVSLICNTDSGSDSDVDYSNCDFDDGRQGGGNVPVNFERVVIDQSLLFSSSTTANSNSYDETEKENNDTDTDVITKIKKTMFHDNRFTPHTPITSNYNVKMSKNKKRNKNKSKKIVQRSFNPVPTQTQSASLGLGLGFGGNRSDTGFRIKLHLSLTASNVHFVTQLSSSSSSSNSNDNMNESIKTFLLEQTKGTPAAMLKSVDFQFDVLHVRVISHSDSDSSAAADGKDDKDGKGRVVGDFKVSLNRINSDDGVSLYNLDNHDDGRNGKKITGTTETESGNNGVYMGINISQNNNNSGDCDDIVNTFNNDNRADVIMQHSQNLMQHDLTYLTKTTKSNTTTKFLRNGNNVNVNVYDGVLSVHLSSLSINNNDENDEYHVKIKQSPHNTSMNMNHIASINETLELPVSYSSHEKVIHSLDLSLHKGNDDDDDGMIGKSVNIDVSSVLMCAGELVFSDVHFGSYGYVGVEFIFTRTSSNATKSQIQTQTQIQTCSNSNSRNSSVNGNSSNAILHLNLTKYTSTRNKPSALKVRSPYLSFCFSDSLQSSKSKSSGSTNGNGNKDRNEKDESDVVVMAIPKQTNAKYVQGYNFIFEEAIILPIPIPSNTNDNNEKMRFIKIELRDGTCESYRIISSSTLPLYTNVMYDGHFVNYSLPFRCFNSDNSDTNNDGGKDGTLEISMQVVHDFDCNAHAHAVNLRKYNPSPSSSLANYMHTTSSHSNDNANDEGSESESENELCIRIERLRDLTSPDFIGVFDPFVCATLTLTSAITSNSNSVGNKSGIDSGKDGFGGSDIQVRYTTLPLSLNKNNSRNGSSSSSSSSRGNERSESVYNQTLIYTLPPHHNNDNASKASTVSVILNVKALTSTRLNSDNECFELGDVNIPISISVPVSDGSEGGMSVPSSWYSLHSSGSGGGGRIKLGVYMRNRNRNHKSDGLDDGDGGMLDYSDIDVDSDVDSDDEILSKRNRKLYKKSAALTTDITLQSLSNPRSNPRSPPSSGVLYLNVLDLQLSQDGIIVKLNVHSVILCVKHNVDDDVFDVTVSYVSNNKGGTGNGNDGSGVICIPLPSTANDANYDGSSGSSAKSGNGSAMSVKVNTEYGGVMYQSEVNVSHALCKGGVEFEGWVALLPQSNSNFNTDKNTDLDTDVEKDVDETEVSKNKNRPSLGRARITTLYIPHTTGILDIKLNVVKLKESCCYLLNYYKSKNGKSKPDPDSANSDSDGSMFVRARVVPGGNWCVGELFDLSNTHTQSSHNDDVKLNLNEVTSSLSLAIDTSLLYTTANTNGANNGNNAITPPLIEFSLFDNSGGLFNVIGTGTMAMSDVLTNNSSGSGNGNGKDAGVSVTLFDVNTNTNGNGISANVGREVGILGLSLKYIPNIRNSDINESVNSTVKRRFVNLAEAMGGLKRLFYSISSASNSSTDTDTDGVVKLDNLIRFILNSREDLFSGLHSHRDNDSNNDSDSAYDLEYYITSITNYFSSGSDGGVVLVTWNGWNRCISFLQTQTTKTRLQTRSRSPTRKPREITNVKRNGNKRKRLSPSSSSSSQLQTKSKSNTPSASSPLRVKKSKHYNQSTTPQTTTSLSKPSHTKHKALQIGSIDPISGLPYTQSDLNRLDSTTTRLRLHNLHSEMLSTSNNREFEDLHLLNGELKRELNRVVRKGKLERSRLKGGIDRVKRIVNEEMGLKDLAKLKHLRHPPMLVYGIDDVDVKNGGNANDVNTLHLNEVNKLLVKSVKLQQTELAMSTKRAEDAEELHRLSLLDYDFDDNNNTNSNYNSNYKYNPTSMSPRTRTHTALNNELQLQLNKATLKNTSLKIQTTSLQNSKLLLSRQYTVQNNTVSTITKDLDIERRKVRLLEIESERIRGVLKSHERANMVRAADASIINLQSVQLKARIEAKERLQLAMHTAHTTASKTLQFAVKGWNDRKEYTNAKKSIVVIQRLLRSKDVQRKYRTQLYTYNNAAVIIQRRRRGMSDRRVLHNEQDACVSVQSVWRRACVRIRYTLVLQVYKKRRLSACAVIQKFYKDTRSKSYAAMKRIVKIQGVVRKRIAERMVGKVRILDAIDQLDEAVQMSLSTDTDTDTNGDDDGDDGIKLLNTAITRAINAGVHDNSTVMLKAVKRKLYIDERHNAITAIYKAIETSESEANADVDVIEKCIDNCRGFGVNDEHACVIKGKEAVLRLKQFNALNALERFMKDTDKDDLKIRYAVDVCVGLDVDNGNVVLVQACGYLKSSTSNANAHALPQVQLLKLKSDKLKSLKTQLKLCQKLLRSDVRTEGDIASCRSGLCVVLGEYDSCFIDSDDDGNDDNDGGDDDENGEKGEGGEKEENFKKKQDNPAQKISKRMLAKLDKALIQEKERKLEIHRVASVFVGIGHRLEGMDDGYLKGLRGGFDVIRAYSDEGEGRGGDLKRMLVKLSVELHQTLQSEQTVYDNDNDSGSGSDVKKSANAAHALDQLTTVLTGPMWAVEDDVRRRFGVMDEFVRGLEIEKGESIGKVTVEEKEVMDKGEEKVEEVKAHVKVVEPVAEVKPKVAAPVVSSVAEQKVVKDADIAKVEDIVKNETSANKTVTPTPKSPPKPMAADEDEKKLMKLATLDPLLSKAFNLPKFANITKLIMADPTVMLDIMTRLNEVFALKENEEAKGIAEGLEGSFGRLKIKFEGVAPESSATLSTVVVNDDENAVAVAALDAGAKPVANADLSGGVAKADEKKIAAPESNAKPAIKDGEKVVAVIVPETKPTKPDIAPTTTAPAPAPTSAIPAPVPVPVPAPTPVPTKQHHLAASSIQSIYKGTKLRSHLAQHNSNFARLPTQPPHGDCKNWEVEVLIEVEEEDQRGEVKVVEGWHLGFVEEWFGFFEGTGKVRDEVKVRLYDDEVNRAVCFGDEDESDNESDDDDEGSDEDEEKKEKRASKLTEITPAGGPSIKYITKRPLGPSSTSNGGWEVSCRLKIELTNTPPSHEWVRGYICKYNPFDDIVSVRFFHDGHMSDYYADMYERKVISKDSDFERDYDCTGTDIRYILERPNSGESAVGWRVRCNCVIGEAEDENGAEEEEYDWVDGRIEGVGISEEQREKDDVDEKVYVVKGVYEREGEEEEDGEKVEGKFEGEIEDPLEVQFFKAPE